MNNQGINVIVVPEKGQFIQDATFSHQIYINSDLGEPNLKGRNAKYIAPYWLDVQEPGVDRVYAIEDMNRSDDGSCWIITLGNSFVLNKKWKGMGNHRKYEYHNLIDFGFVEIKDGLLMLI